MRILLTNIQLNGRTGTEIVIRDLALGLRAAGCEPVVYSPNLGCMADEIGKSGIPVVSNLDDLEAAPDVIHGHHHVETLAALHRFPGVPGIFVCHDATAWHDFPPIHPMLRAYVVISFYGRERLVREALLAEEEIRMIGNAVDLNRFRLRPPLPKKPARAVLFSNYAKTGDVWLDAVRAACEAEGLSLEVIGSGVGRSCERPETVLGDFDIVFGIGRCALEAMATGCAAILCSASGLWEMVTPENVENGLNWNFAVRLLTRQATQESLQAEIRRYDPASARAVSAVIRQRCSVDKAVGTYLSLYKAVLHPSTKMAAFASRWAVRLQHQLIVRHAANERLESAASPSASLQPDMPRLAPSDLAGIHLRLIHETDRLQVQAGRVFRLDAVLRNGSRLTLSGGRVLPLAFCHHWRSGTTGAMLIYENARTLLTSPIAPGAESRVTLTLAAPTEPGLYHLEMTLVQDHVLWFDGLTPDFPVTVPVAVLPAHVP
jgi:hypothetical protein